MEEQPSALRAITRLGMILIPGLALICQYNPRLYVSLFLPVLGGIGILIIILKEIPGSPNSGQSFLRGRKAVIAGVIITAFSWGMYYLIKQQM